MRFPVISDGQANPGAQSISFPRALTELRRGSIQLAAVLWSAGELEQTQFAVDGVAGPSRGDAVDLSQWPPLVNLNIHRTLLFSRDCALPWAQEIDSTDSRWRC